MDPLISPSNADYAVDLTTTMGPTHSGHIPGAGPPEESTAFFNRIDPPGQPDPGIKWVAPPVAGDTIENMTGPCLALLMGISHIPTSQSDIP